MDNLSRDVITKIYNFLPWRDQIAIRRLSSKFVDLIEEKYSFYRLILREEKDNFSFTLQDWRVEAGLDDEPRWMIEIVKETATGRDIVITKIARENAFPFFTQEGEEASHKTIISCPEPGQFHHFINAYFRMFFTYFYINKIELVNLSPRYLKEINEVRLKEIIEEDTEVRWLSIHTSNSILDEEERNLLRRSKENYSLYFGPPSDFQIPADFWQLMPYHDITLNFGGTCERQGDVVDFDLGINDDFIRDRIKNGQVSIRAFVITDVSPDFIQNYVEEALLGGNMMYELTMYHKFDPTALDDLLDFIDDSGFERVYENITAKNVETRKAKEGDDPDRLLVLVSTDFFRIIADYACYRGEKSMLDPEHPFGNQSK